MRNQSDDCEKPSPLMGEGLGGGVPRRDSQAEARNAAAADVIPIRRVLGYVTPTLARPIKGAGKRLTICEYPSPSWGRAPMAAHMKIVTAIESPGTEKAPRSPVGPILGA